MLAMRVRPVPRKSIKSTNHLVPSTQSASIIGSVQTVSSQIYLLVMILLDHPLKRYTVKPVDCKGLHNFRSPLTKTFS